MEEKYLVDLRHLIDLNKLTVYINLSDCCEYDYPTDLMNYLCSLLKYVKENINDLCFYDIKDINKNVFDSLIKKITKYKDWIYTLDDYISFANDKIKSDRGWPQNALSHIGLPNDSLQITLEELIIFYKVLENVQSSYNDIKENHLTYSNVYCYVMNIENIKTMLEKRLMYTISKSI